jgi:hypothetical protein
VIAEQHLDTITAVVTDGLPQNVDVLKRYLTNLMKVRSEKDLEKERQNKMEELRLLYAARITGSMTHRTEDELRSIQARGIQAAATAERNMSDLGF